MRKLMTQAGFARARARLAAAEAEYAAIVGSNPEAAEAGDSSVWHDNFAFEENQRQMHQWARRVVELRRVLQESDLIEVPHVPTTVEIGTRVTVEDSDSGERRTYTIGSFDDGDPRADRIAYNAPLGRALLGAQAGDEREVER